MFEAKVIAHSISPEGREIATLQLRYPRFIHSELMTHRVFSRNASSSRAIPVAKMIEQVRNDPAMPIHWGKNQPGMQANEQLEGADRMWAKNLWREAAQEAAAIAERMAALGLHKQVANRILEPFQFMNTIVTSTEWDNFFELRCHPDAQPEFQALACLMRDALTASTPTSLGYGEWHLPYVGTFREEDGTLTYGLDDMGHVLSLEDALKVSASCCAQVSYRKLDDSLDKAHDIFDRLVSSRPFHASPFEHQAAPVVDIYSSEPIGTGNFVGWVQHRKLLESDDHWQDEVVQP